jgi:hypothetical protein
MHLSRRGLLVSVAAAACVPAAAQQDSSNVQSQTAEVADDRYRLVGAGEAERRGF